MQINNSSSRLNILWESQGFHGTPSLYYRAHTILGYTDNGQGSNTRVFQGLVRDGARAHMHMRVPQRNATPTQPVSRMHLINSPPPPPPILGSLGAGQKVTCLQQQLQQFTYSAVESNTLLLPHFNKQPPQLQPCLGRIHPTQVFNYTTWPHMARPRQPHSSFVPFGWTDRTPSSFTSVACASLSQRITVQYPSYDII